MAPRERFAFSPFFLASNALIWASAVIVMGITAYFVSQSAQGSHVIYELVISVLTTAFFLAAFFIGAFTGAILLFNLIFAFLWIVAVAFTADDFSNSGSNLALTVEAFSFIAFFFLFFNVVYDWHFGYRGATAPTRSTV